MLGTCLPRPIYFMAKQEIFRNPFVGWLLNCLGAFPVKRGESDEESTKTSLMLLERGEAVVIFPEGTRIRRGSLGTPQRGVGRLALESGVPWCRSPCPAASAPGAAGASAGEGPPALRARRSPSRAWRTRRRSWPAR